MKAIKSNQIKLAIQTHGAAYSYWDEASQTYKDGRLEADTLLVKQVAKEVLRNTISHQSWNAMYNSKLWLRKAARTGDFRDLPEWLRTRISKLYHKFSNIHRPRGLS